MTGTGTRFLRVGLSAAVSQPKGRFRRMVLRRQDMQPGPHVKARHGGAPRGRPD